MNELSKKVIEVEGQEYSLFLNRKGLIQWEKISKVSETAKEMQKYAEIEHKDVVINEDNPFDGAENEDIEEDLHKMEEIYIKFYWIALYEFHKMNLSDTKTWFEKAKAEYGIDQLVELVKQIVEDINTDKNSQIKKLTALRPTKK